MSLTEARHHQPYRHGSLRAAALSGRCAAGRSVREDPRGFYGHQTNFGGHERCVRPRPQGAISRVCPKHSYCCTDSTRLQSTSFVDWKTNTWPAVRCRSQSYAQTCNLYTTQLYSIQVYLTRLYSVLPSYSYIIELVFVGSFFFSEASHTFLH